MNELNPLEWFRFVGYVRATNRFVLNKPLNRFIAQVLESAESRRQILRGGTEYFRARTHEEIFISSQFTPFSADLMGAPPSQLTKEGRINPKGVPYLYLSDCAEVARAEVRPNKKQIVQVARFKLKRDVQVVDIKIERSAGRQLSVALAGAIKSSPASLERELWRLIDTAFCAPTLPGDPHQIYAPTQYLAAACKQRGYDGILYSSALSDAGHNLVLFDVNTAEICGQGESDFFQVESISYAFSKIDLGLEVLKGLLTNPNPKV